MNDESQLLIFEPRKSTRKVIIKEVEESKGDLIPIYNEDGSTITDYKVQYNELEEEVDPTKEEIVEFIEKWEAGNEVSEQQAKKNAKRKRLREQRKRRKEHSKRLKVTSSDAQCDIEPNPLVEEERAILRAMKVRQPSVRKIFNIKPTTCIPLDTNFNPSRNPTIQLKRKKLIDTVVLDDSDESDSGDNIRLNIDNAGQSTSTFTRDGPFRTYKSFVTTDDLKQRKKKKVEIVQISDSSDSELECVPVDDPIQSISDDEDDNLAKKPTQSIETNTMDIDDEEIPPIDENISGQLVGLVDNFVEKYIHSVLPSLPKNRLPPEPENYSEHGNRKRVTFNEVVTQCDDEPNTEHTETHIMEVDKPESSNVQNEDQSLLNNVSKENQCKSRKGGVIEVEQIDSDSSVNEEDSDDSNIDFYDMVPSPNYDPIDNSEDALARLSDPDVVELSSYISSQLNKKPTKPENPQISAKNNNFQNRFLPSNRFQRGRAKRPFGNSQNCRPQKAYQKPESPSSERFSQLYDELHKSGPQNSSKSAPQPEQTEHRHASCQKSNVSNSQFKSKPTSQKPFHPDDDIIENNQPADSSIQQFRSKGPFQKRAFQSFPNDNEDSDQESVICVNSEPGPCRKRHIPQRPQQQQNYNKPVSLAGKCSCQCKSLQNEQFYEDDFQAEKPKNFQTESYKKSFPAQRISVPGDIQKRASQSYIQNESFQDNFEHEPKNFSTKNQNRPLLKSRYPQTRPSQSTSIPYEPFEEECDFEEEKPKNFASENNRSAPMQRFRNRGGMSTRAYQSNISQNEHLEDDTPQGPNRYFNKRFCPQNPQNFNEPFEEEKFDCNRLRENAAECSEETYEKDAFNTDPGVQRNIRWRKSAPEWQGQFAESNRPRFANQQKPFTGNKHNFNEPYEEDKYHPPQRFVPQQRYSQNSTSRYKRFPQQEPYEEEKYHPPPNQSQRFSNQNSAQDIAYGPEKDSKPHKNNYQEPYEEEKFHVDGRGGNFNQSNRFPRNNFQNRFTGSNSGNFNQNQRFPNQRFQNRQNFPNRFSNPRFNNQHQQRFQNRQRFPSVQNSQLSQEALFTRRNDQFHYRPDSSNFNQKSSQDPKYFPKGSETQKNDDLQQYESSVMQKFTADPSLPDSDIFTWENKKSFDFVEIPADEPPWNNMDSSPNIKSISRRSWIDDNVMNQS